MPEDLLLRDPFLDQVQRFWPESEKVLSTDFSPLNQSRPFQHPDMFGNRIERYPEWLGQVGHPRFRPSEAP